MYLVLYIYLQEWTESLEINGSNFVDICACI